MRRFLVGLLFCVPSGTEAAPVPQVPPKPLPEKVVTAWQKAGAEVGWLGPREDGHYQFRTGEPARVGEVPGFRILQWKRGLLDDLPAPDQPFGLSLGYSGVEADAPREIARF